MAAVKLALRMGPEKFNQYIHDFGFGARSDVELPAETRGLLRPTRRWSRIEHRFHRHRTGGGGHAHPTGHHGFHHRQRRRLPASSHPDASRRIRPPGKLRAAAFHPQGELPDPLPAGAHRVISTMTAAQMRKMMEGVVLFGTAKNGAAQRLHLRGQDRHRAKNRCR